MTSTRVWVGATAPPPQLNLNLSTHMLNALDEEDDGGLAKLLNKRGAVVWVDEMTGIGADRKKELEAQGVAVGAGGRASCGLHIIIKLELPRSIAANGIYYGIYRLETWFGPLKEGMAGAPV